MTRWRDFFFRPSHGLSLAAVRIVLGAAMLIEALRVFPSLDQLYGPYGYLQADLLETLTGIALPGLLSRMGVSAQAYVFDFKIFYLLHIFLCVCFAIGYKSRFSTIAVWFTQMVILNSGYLSSYGVDRYFQNIAFLMIWFPVSEQWSVDEWLSRGRAVKTPRSNCTFGLRLIQLFMLLTYVDAGFSKAAGTDWWTGEAIWRVLNQPEFHRFDFLWLASHPWLPKLLARSTIFIEGLYGIGIWIPVFGAFWILVIAGLHLGIALTMGLTLFGSTLAALNLAVFSDLLLKNFLRLRDLRSRSSIAKS